MWHNHIGYHINSSRRKWTGVIDQSMLEIFILVYLAITMFTLCQILSQEKKAKTSRRIFSNNKCESILNANVRATNDKHGDIQKEALKDTRNPVV